MYMLTFFQAVFEQDKRHSAAPSLIYAPKSHTSRYGATASNNAALGELRLHHMLPFADD